jgi:hypothetical protein
MIACLTVAITSFSGSGCFTHNQTNLGIFLLIDALFYFLFIRASPISAQQARVLVLTDWSAVFAWRVQRVLAKPYDKTAKEPGCCSPEVWSRYNIRLASCQLTSLDTDRASCNPRRVWQFMWKDISFLIFLVVAGCAIAWNVIGLFWANLVDEANRYSSRTICVRTCPLNPILVPGTLLGGVLLTSLSSCTALWQPIPAAPCRPQPQPHRASHSPL